MFVELNGKAGSSPPHSLIAPGRASDSFGRGQTDSFTLQLPELGELQSLTIGRIALHFHNKAVFVQILVQTQCRVAVLMSVSVWGNDLFEICYWPARCDCKHLFDAACRPTRFLIANSEWAVKLEHPLTAKHWWPASVF